MKDREIRKRKQDSQKRNKRKYYLQNVQVYVLKSHKRSEGKKEKKRGRIRNGV